MKLLIGENPDLSQVISNRNLAPYRELATAVMRGDLTTYRKVVEERNTVFKEARLDRVIDRFYLFLIYSLVFIIRLFVLLW